MRFTRLRTRRTVVLVLCLVATITVGKITVDRRPVRETRAMQAERLVCVGMTYEEAKTSLGEDGFRAGTNGGETYVTWSWMDSSFDVTFDANWRVTFATIYKPKKPDAPFWDILTHMGY